MPINWVSFAKISIDFIPKPHLIYVQLIVNRKLILSHQIQYNENVQYSLKYIPKYKVINVHIIYIYTTYIGSDLCEFDCGLSHLKWTSLGTRYIITTMNCFHMTYLVIQSDKLYSMRENDVCMCMDDIILCHYGWILGVYSNCLNCVKIEYTWIVVYII